MATTNRTAEQISKAIEVLNRQRNPLLRIVNAPKFELASPRAWAVSYQLQGLNIAARHLEETRVRYLSA